MKKHVLSIFALTLMFHFHAFGQKGETAPKAFERGFLKARPLPLESVRLLGGPLKQSQDVTAEYLLELEPDRMLAGYRIRAGLEPKAEGYGGWDAVDSRQLTGHIAGHYLSGISLMYAATGNEEFKRRADYIVEEFKEVQARRGNGYLGAIINRDGVDAAEVFEQVSRGDIRSGGFDLNGLWSPWYTLHKTYAGLRDAYRYTGNETALELEIQFAEWAEHILSPMTNKQIQQMLNTEFGGMNEVMVDLYADTGDERWLDLSYKFEHLSFIEPLKRHQDILDGKHGNTQVPKLIGSADRFAYTGNPGDLLAAGFFWDRVVQHHSFATGGHGKDEYFHKPDKLSEIVDGRTAETCNIYNMLKLTRRLFAVSPDAHYADFHERALFNHILGSIDPSDGKTCYMVPVGRGVQHEYQDMFRGFTCCVGTGLESHALHGYGIYYESGDKLWVNLYAPSEASWAEAGLRLRMETGFPQGESAKLQLELQSPKDLTLALRKPYWAGEGFSISINGETVAEEVVDPYGDVPESGRQVEHGIGPSSSYVELRRTWKSGDTVEIALPKSLHLEPTTDNPRVAAILWGPLVLAGDLGPAQERSRERRGDTSYERPKVPVFIAAEQPIEQWVKPVDGEPGNFRVTDISRDSSGSDERLDASLVPFYRLHQRSYAIYFDLFTQPEWEDKKAAYVIEQERMRKLEQATVAYAQPGEMQPERDFNYQGPEEARVMRTMGRAGRRSDSWFSFDLPVEGSHPMALVITYNSGERSTRTFDIVVDGRRIAEQAIEGQSPARFFDIEYALPPDLVEGKQKVTVRFQATNDNQTAAVYGIRMIRSNLER